jgi:hyaluronoglucosaminidase
MSSRYFGYIEGYYGRMLSWEERSHILTHMRALSLNTYLYAPKEDPYHRQQWRTPYPRQWIDAFSLFVKKGNNAGITIIPGIAPGLSFDYCSKADYALLVRKCLALAKTGVPALCLLMDDIPVSLPKNCEKAFASLGAAHGNLLARLSVDLKKAFPAIRLWFCPTVYADQLIKDDPLARNYLEDLSVSMPRSILVLWTGSHVISKEISGKTLGRVVELFKGNVCIWDNIYANDYCPRKLFIGSYKNRSADVLKVTRGILLNPTGLVHTDTFLLSLLSGYVKKMGPEKAWNLAVQKLSFADEIKTIAPYFDIPYVKLPQKAFAPRSLMRVKRALKKLLWQWKDPLQREWYPFLYSLDSDIALLECKTAEQRQKWLDKKCPPLLAKIILTNTKLHSR